MHYIEGTECGVSNVYGLWGPPAPFILEPIKIKVGGLFKKCIYKKGDRKQIGSIAL